MKEATAEYNQPEIAWLQSGYVLSLSVCIPLHNFISHSRKRNNCQSIKVHVPMSVYQFNWIHLPIAENIFAVCFNYCTKWQLRDISNSDQCTNSKWAFSSLIYFYSNSPLNSPYVWMWFLVSTVGFIIFDRSDPLTPFHSLRSHIRLMIPFPQLTTTNQFNFPELILVFAHLPLSHSIFNKFQILQLTYFISRQFHFNSMESYVLFFRYLNSLSVSLN